MSARGPRPRTKKGAPGGAFFLQRLTAQRVFLRACASALPAPDLDVALVRSLRNVDNASFAAVDLLLNVLDAFDAVFLPVSFATTHRERKGNNRMCMWRAEYQIQNTEPTPAANFQGAGLSMGRAMPTCTNPLKSVMPNPAVARAPFVACEMAPGLHAAPN